MTRAELKAALKRYGFDDNDPLDVWVNAARNEVVTDGKLPTLDVELTGLPGTANQSELLVPSDFFKIISLVEMVRKSNLDPMEYREFLRTTSNPLMSGTPHTFTTQGLNRVLVYPVPAYDPSWKLIYQQKVSQLTSDDLSPYELDETFHYTIVFRAAAIGLMAENEEERAETAMSEYAGGIEKIQKAYGTTQLNRFYAVNDVMEYGDL